MTNVLERASRIALDLFFPPQCGGCASAGALVCHECIGGLQPADGRRCARCWLPMARRGLCRHCSDTPPSFASIRAAFVLDGTARKLAHQLKYDGMTALAEPMAELIVQETIMPVADVVVPVPLHRSRERSRGYNQASELARHVAALTDTAYERGAVRRTRPTAPLVKTMHREERLAIMRGAFAADARRLDGKAVLLIDDVVTTGATLDSCGEAILAAGACEVRCVTWARAD